MDSFRRLAVVGLLAPASFAAHAQIAVIHESAKLSRSTNAAVAIDGKSAIVSDFLDSDRGLDAGAVYVFERDAAGSWLEADKLTGSAAQPCDRFGRAVALKGKTLIVGHAVTQAQAGSSVRCAPSLVNPLGRGGTYAFERDSDGWLETAHFGGFIWPVGFELAFDGRRFLTGRQTTALLYERNDDGTWSAPISLRNTGIGAPDDEYAGPDVGIFGTSAILGDSTAASGAPAFTGTPHADIFGLDAAGNWNIVADLNPPGAVRSRFMYAQVSVADGIASVDEFIYKRDANGVWVPDGTFVAADVPAGARYKARMEGAGTAVVNAGGSLHVFLRSDDDRWVETAQPGPYGGDSLGR